MGSKLESDMLTIAANTLINTPFNPFSAAGFGFAKSSCIIETFVVEGIKYTVVV